MESNTLDVSVQSEMLKEVLEGFGKPQKTLPSKYFYDKRGSELFDQIVKFASQDFILKKGETIQIENSHKYSLRSFREMTDPYFKNVTTWIDSDNKFCV